MPSAIDHTGKVFENWTVLKRIMPMRPQKYLCKCSCGNESVVFFSNLRSGKTKGCPKCQSLRSKIEFIGKKFNHLTLLDFKKINNKKMCVVLCDCGNKRELEFGRINKTENPIIGKYMSCGRCTLVRSKIIYESKKMFIIDNKIGMLTIKKNLGDGCYLAKCECGNIKKIKKHHLIKKLYPPSCGCYLRKIREENAKKLEGIKHGYLKVLNFLKMDRNKRGQSRAIYILKCKCGKKFEESISYVFGAKSCGCMRKELYKKGIIRAASKLKDFEVISIRQLYKSKLYSCLDLSKMFNISYEHTCSIVKNKVWKYLII